MSTMDRIPDLSVIIVNWNTREDLTRCIESVMADAGNTIEVVVVDNASGDGSAEMVGKRFPMITLVRNDRNLGFATAGNQGIRVSRGRFVFLLNPDSEVVPGTLAALVRFGDENPDVGLFGPKVLNPDGSIQHSCRRFPTLRAALFRNTTLGRLFPNNRYTRDYLMADWSHDRPRDVDWLSGAALVLRRETLDRIDLFDERFFMYCEDIDISYRAMKAGIRRMYVPTASVVHTVARGSDQAPNRMIWAHHRSMHAFFRKHLWDDTWIILRILVPLGLYAKASILILRNHVLSAAGLVTGHRHKARAWSPPAQTVEEGNTHEP